MMIDLMPTQAVSGTGAYDQEIHVALDMGDYTDLSLLFHVWSGTATLHLLTAMENRAERYIASDALASDITAGNGVQIYLTGPGQLASGGNTGLPSPARFVRARVVTAGAAVFEVKGLLRMR